MEKLKTKVKNLRSNTPMIDNFTECRHTLVSSRIRKDLKRKNGFDKTPKSNFSKYLQMELAGSSAEEDLKLERRLAKKLKVKNGRLSVANDDIDMLLEGIPSVLDNLGEIEKDSKGFEEGTLSRKCEKRNSVNEDLDDKASVEEGEENSDSLASSEEDVNEDVDDEISAEEGDEESDSLASGEKDVKEDVDEEISGEEGDEGSDSLGGSAEDGSEDVDDEISVEGDEESDSPARREEEDDGVEVISQKDSNKGKRKETKFEEYLESDIQGDKRVAEADLALERKLAKKLKVKAGKVHGGDDDINMLLDRIPSVLDSLGNGGLKNSADYPKKSSKFRNSKFNEQEQKAETRISSNTEASEPLETFSPEVAVENFPVMEPGKYVAPHLRSPSGNDSAEHAQVRKRVRGLLNRLSETNVESITGEISTIFHSVGRIVGSQIISEEVIASCSGGPRGNEQYAAVFAAFVAGMASLVGIDFGAKLLACLAKCFEEEYLKEDNLSLRNLTLLFSYLYVFGLCSSDLIFDFLIMLGKRLTEVDVSTVLTVLQCCGMKLRGDDPAGMKNFISSVQIRVNELKACSGDGQSNLSSKRMEFMIETICDIKNNKKRSKEDTVQHTQIKKWLQKLRVDDILIRGLKWSKLLDPSKKGQWWLSGDVASTTENIEEVAGTIDKETTETKKMLQLAASQRMNTDARRAIFCVIMSADDYIDAFEKILRLDLPGKQDREIMRVLVGCCLQEKVFNKYYCVLASKLCSYDKNHKFTLQYCLWDHFKELESMSLIRSMHLSKFVAEMVASFSLSLAVLKAVDLNDPVHLNPKRIMHFRMLFEAIFEFPDKLVWNIFTRIAVTPEYESLRSGIELFIRKYVVGVQKSLASKFKIARKALNNVEGIVM
ncbi:Protein involved in high osmolarity signaling pathway [Handroanthus impetiginosus]|uniref:Protein involved in high osmolarity signaling pathway n=1 Tax=Handroanthus impetiginosus TaxID=429701 RepID=A0A2G9GDN3_9LAMI|nr:Protein involved in high osmolarity signaling pathway [Handroanthus impetiginosus]